MKRLAADVESDGLLDTLTTIHCLCAKDVDTGEEWSFGPDEIKDGLSLLDGADEVYFHNGIGFDCEALRMTHGWEPKAKVIDTLVLARLCHSDQKDKDINSSKASIRALSGSMSLKAWGERLGVSKGDYGEQEGAWKTYTPQMREYCLQDVRVTVRLIRHLLPLLPPPQAVDLEMRTAAYAEECNRRGWLFDVEGARKLLKTLTDRQDTLREELVRLFPGEMETMKTPAYWSLVKPDGSVSRGATKGEVDKLRKSLGLKPKECRLEPGPPKVRVHDFNPGSRKQIATQLHQRYGWVSPELTPKGQELFEDGEGGFEELALDYGQVSEDILEGLEYPEAPLLVEYMMLGKRIGQVGAGANAWLNLVSGDGRLRYRLNPCGTVTQRMTHTAPNLSQVVGGNKPYGHEFRALFQAEEGRSLVGADLAQIESRLLGHYLWPFDGGKYADVVVNGDIHSLNATVMQLGRSESKKVWYSIAYGAGAVKVGKTVVASSEEWRRDFTERCNRYKKTIPINKATRKAFGDIGKIIKGRLESGIDGMTDLIEAVVSASERKGYLNPLDGRRIPVRSPHAALNSLLQSAAAVIAKRWAVSTFDDCRRRGVDAQMLIVSHDEIQSTCANDAIEEYKEIVLNRIRWAGQFYRLKLELEGEAKVGRNWAETH